MIIVMNILKIMGIIIGAYAVFMLIVAIVPGFSVPKQPLKKTKQIPKVVDTKPSWSRKDVIFKVKGTSLFVFRKPALQYSHLTTDILVKARVNLDSLYGSRTNKKIM